MTYCEIEKCLLFVESINRCESVAEFETLLKEIKNYLNVKYDAHLLIDSWTNIYDTNYGEFKFKSDKLSLISFINGLIESDPYSAEIMYVAKDVKKGEASLLSIGEMEKFVVYVYTTYNSKISFPEIVIDFCSASKATRNQFQTPISKPIVEGIVQSLKNYAVALSKPKFSDSNSLANITNVFNPSNSVNIDVTVTIENARNMAENAGLSQSQLDEVNDKINEIQELLETKDSKNKKWSKAGEILKWVAEQGIQIASFMIPLLCSLV